MLDALSDRDFHGFRALLEDLSGIHVADTKKALVVGRLASRVRHHGLAGYGDYLALVRSDPAERQVALDLLTTNETYFFREPEHFALLARTIAPRLRARGDVRVWCGASSSGEEPYCIAMVLANALGHLRFEVLASDISTRMLAAGRKGLYPIEEAARIPAPLRNAWCLKGVGAQAGSLQIDPVLRARVRFEQINLCETLPDIGSFDLVFLRNVMIYFTRETKQQVVARVLERLRPDGHFFVSHSESLQGLADGLRMVRPSVYRKEAFAEETA